MDALSESGPTLHREAALVHRFLRRPSGSETVERVAALLLEHGTIGPSACVYGGIGRTCVMEQLQQWQNFYLLLGSASATLVGLMFIAISLGSGRWTPEERPILNVSFGAFMSPTFIHFVYVLVTAIVVFVPTLSGTVFGGLLILTGIGGLGHIARHLRFLIDRYRAHGIDRSDLVWYLLMPSIAYVLYLGAGAGLLRAGLRGARPVHALDALAAASVLLLIIGVRNAWDLVVFLVLRQLDTPGRQ